MSAPTVTPTPTATSRRAITLPPAWLMTVAAVLLAAVLLAAVTYVVRFGGCDIRSRFCYVGLAGTRSEVVVVWLDGIEVYTQTAPAE